MAATKVVRIEGEAGATPSMAPGPAVETTAGTASRRPRRRRAAISKWAQPVYPLKSIWDAASEEERQKARELATELLGLWLGLQSKEELAKRLSVPPIRIWQMGQRAVAGMVVAMLKPPAGRRGPMPRQEPAVAELRARVATLEKELGISRRLVEILRTMPGSVAPKEPKEESGAARARVRERGQRSRKASAPRAAGGPPREAATGR